VRVINDNLDLSRYLDTPPDAANIKPASNWCQDVIDRFYSDNPDPGARLPWRKTHAHIKLRPGEVSIWAGINGHGKSALLNQVMVGVMTQGEKVCIASMEMKPVQTMHRMSRQAIGVGSPSMQSLRALMHWTDGKLWIYDQLGTVKRERMMAVVRYCREELGIAHMVIDSLMKCGIDTDDYNRQKAFVDELCAHAKDTGMHIHLVAHSRKSSSEKNEMDKMDIKGASEIADQVDNIFTLWRNKRKEEEHQKPNPSSDVIAMPDALLTCSKQRHGEWEGKITLWFHKESMQFINKNCGQPMDMVNDLIIAPDRG
jgi:twinkle protein